MAIVKGFVKAVFKNKHGFDMINVANEREKDGIFIGLCTKDGPTFNGVSFKKGMNVEVEYDEDNWNNIIAAKELEKAGGGRGGSGGGNRSYSGGNRGSAAGGKKRDTSGMETGHAINGAFILTKHQKTDVMDEVEIVHSLTVKLKAEYAEANPDMSDYDAGAAVGHAVLNACRFVAENSKYKVEHLEKLAKGILEKLVPKALALVKGEVEEDEWEQEEEKPAPKTTSKGRGRPKKAKEPEPEPEEEEYEEDDAFEDDIPFS